MDLSQSIIEKAIEIAAKKEFIYLSSCSMVTNKILNLMSLWTKMVEYFRIAVAIYNGHERIIDDY